MTNFGSRSYDLSNLNMEHRSIVETRSEELAELVRIISLRPELRMTITEPNTPWSFNFEHHLVSAPVNDLINESEDYCRGLTLHEAAHATVTRVFDMLNPKIARERSYHSLLNVIEDCRIETWIMERSPGATPWIQEYNDKLFGPFLQGEISKSLCSQFLGAILSKWWFKELPQGLDKQVTDALARCDASIKRAIAAQPPTEIGRSQMYSEIYKGNRSLNMIYMQSDLYSPPSDFECAVRLRQLQMLIIVTQEILPVYESLIDQDKTNLGEDHLSSSLLQLLTQLRGDHLSTSTGQRRDLTPEKGGEISLNESGLNGSTDQFNQSPESINSPESEGQSLPSQQQLRQQIETALRVDPRDQYLSAWRGLAHEIDILSDELIRVIEKRAKPKWLRGCSSGARLDLRQAMAFEADPRLYQSLWMRQIKPTKIDPAFMVLIDISGSMQGDNIEGAFRGLVLFTEVCTRLNIPLEVIAFHNEVRQIKYWDDPVDETQRDRLGKLPNQVGGGTNLTDALKRAYLRLSDIHYTDRFLITLGDGEPDDVDTVHKEVKRLKNLNVHCIGVGVGSGTAQLSRFFDEGVYDVTPLQLSSQLGEILDRILRT